MLSRPILGTGRISEPDLASGQKDVGRRKPGVKPCKLSLVLKFFEALEMCKHRIERCFDHWPEGNWLPVQAAFVCQNTDNDWQAILDAQHRRARFSPRNLTSKSGERMIGLNHVAASLSRDRPFAAPISSDEYSVADPWERPRCERNCHCIRHRVFKTQKPEIKSHPGCLRADTEAVDRVRRGDTARQGLWQGKPRCAARLKREAITPDLHITELPTQAVSGCQDEVSGYKRSRTRRLTRNQHAAHGCEGCWLRRNSRRRHCEAKKGFSDHSERLAGARKPVNARRQGRTK